MAAALSHADSGLLLAGPYVLSSRTDCFSGQESDEPRPRLQSKQFRVRDRLTSRARQEAGSDDRIEGRRQRNRVSLAANGCYDKERNVHFWACNGRHPAWGK